MICFGDAFHLIGRVGTCRFFKALASSSLGQIEQRPPFRVEGVKSSRDKALQVARISCLFVFVFTLDCFLEFTILDHAQKELVYFSI